MVLIVSLLPIAGKGQAPDQMLLLDVQINGHTLGQIGEFTLHDGILLATRKELLVFGIREPAGLMARPAPGGDNDSELTSLSGLPGLSWRIDFETQTLLITASDASLLTTILHGRESNSALLLSQHPIDSGLGATVNYDVTGILQGSTIESSGSLDARVFSRFGVVSLDVLGYVGSETKTGPGSPTGAGAWQQPAPDRIVRLDTAYTFADVKTLRRYSLGDFITGGLSWTRPLRLTGVQVRSDFTMRPDLVTFPLPSLGGSATVPSTISVLANGSEVFSSVVDPGPFQIPQLPVVNGASVITMTVTNSLGQQVVVSQPFYASVTLLAPGLQTFSAQAGLVRRAWGEASNDYGKAAGLGDYRRGLTPKLTVEASAEATPGTVMGGAGAVVAVGNLGVINASAATSAGSGLMGSQVSLGVQRIGGKISLGGSAQFATQDFQDVASMNGDGVTRRQLAAYGSMLTRRLGSFGAAYAEIRQDAPLHPLNIFPTDPQRAQILTLSYSLQFRHISYYANEFQDFANQDSGGVQFGVTVPIGRRSSVNASAGTGSSGAAQVQIQQSAAMVGEWGYDAYVAATTPLHEFAQVQYKSHWALLTGGVDQNGSQTTFRAETQGAVSWLDGGIFPSDTIYDSFAVVDTNGLPNVNVLQENRTVGRTDSKGRLLVPDMRAFDLNHLAIDPGDIPLDTTIDTDSREIRPQDRSGVVVRFPVKVSHGALLLLVNSLGVPLAIGSSVRLLSNDQMFPVGYEGETYIEDLNSLNKIEVEFPNGTHCIIAFSYVPVKGVIPTIGPLQCVEGKR